jgi:hypothetical protein
MAASPIESELASQQKKAVAWDRFRVTDVLDALVQSHVEKSTKESPSADCVSSGDESVGWIIACDETYYNCGPRTPS